MIEQAGIGRRIRAPRPLDRALVDRHHVIHGGEVAVDEARFTGTGNARDNSENACGYIDIDVAKIVRAGATNLDSSRGGARGVLDLQMVGQVAPGESIGVTQLLNGSFEADPTALVAGSRSQVHHVIGDLDRLRLVLDDEHCVSLVPQGQQELIQKVEVVRVQTDTGLIEDVSDVGESRTQVAYKLGALGLTA